MSKDPVTGRIPDVPPEVRDKRVRDRKARQARIDQEAESPLAKFKRVWGTEGEDG